MSNKSKECMLCHHWYFKDIGYEYKQCFCIRCRDLSLMVYDLDDFLILNTKCVDYRCLVFNMSKGDGIKLLNNSALDNKGIL